MFKNKDKKRKISSIVLAVLLLIVAIFIFIKSNNYIHSIIWILLSPLAISAHPVFYQSPEKMEISPQKHQKQRKWLNIFRFLCFFIGIFLFFIQVFKDFH